MVLRLFRSYVAIGDSFTEGMGDIHPAGPLAGLERGWADLVAGGLSNAAGEPIRYANLAVRGRKLGPLVDEQLEPALAMRPELVSINGGGNDLLRPRMGVDRVAGMLVDAARRIADAGAHVLLLSGADPSQHMPLGGLVHRRGVELIDAVRARLDALDAGSYTLVDNFSDTRLRGAGYWARDGLHMNVRGHHRVAANVLQGLGIAVPTAYAETVETELPLEDWSGGEYWREYVLPWIGRRVTGRSSGDGRTAKLPELGPYPG